MEGILRKYCQHINPLEVFDGALVSGNCVSAGSKTTTYHHQNNAIIKECFKRHGKEINFIGVVLSPMTTVLDDKYRNSILTSRIVEITWGRWCYSVSGRLWKSYNRFNDDLQEVGK